MFALAPLLVFLPLLGLAINIAIGGRVSEKVCDYVGADGWADDAMRGLRLCNRLIRK